MRRSTATRNVAVRVQTLTARLAGDSQGNPGAGEPHQVFAGFPPFASRLTRRIAMFWKFILIAALAVGLLQLGAFSVWVVILKAGLIFAVLVICGLVLSMLWRKASAKSD